MVSGEKENSVADQEWPVARFIATGFLSSDMFDLDSTDNGRVLFVS
jgi:hypothetical protein